MSTKISRTQTKILESAAALLLNSRGEGVRMEDIASSAGVSRQAVYLHFPSRGELMIAAVRYLDDVYGLDEEVRRFREARSGIEILETFVEFWGNYIPKIFGVAKALMELRERDDAAAAAWKDRMDSVRNGCRRTIETIEHEGLLSNEWEIDEAVDLMWAMLSIENWVRLTKERGWSQTEYIARLTKALKRIVLASG